ncbi:hypothetical protein KIV65_gp14 [Mycobacterium phage Anthony]|uniref:Uncharacterized protein n=1 Tax=Mycobacterium phage Anthony TaxID=2599857 RepID=A0A5J6THI8_9CAUD|nr:hypothetical protein KIV65_gp14 [Mycobacterium phage Anthony]QFG10453.1 hypothetical protein PBI_ANTHONY_83 [Mycobacterium phage Anthony]
MRVFVYRNLHKGCYSVRAEEGPDKGRVVAHSEHVLLGGVTPKVSAAGRDRVRRERRKNVHAGLTGELLSLEEQDFIGSKVTYNPYRADGFVYATTEAPFAGSPEVYLSDSGVRAMAN